jgi:hypothetical protein
MQKQKRSADDFEGSRSDFCLYIEYVLPPSQNVRRLSFSQKSTSSKFDQVHMKNYEYI